MPKLKTTSGANPLPKPVNFGDEPIYIGRAKNCEIVLHDKLASRKHAKAYREQGFFFIEDLDSINGTLVNDKELKGSKKLLPGDVIKIGDHEITFDDSAAKAPAIPSNSENKVAAVKYETPNNEHPFGAPGTIYNLKISNRTQNFSNPLLKPITTIGREGDADVSIDEQLASRLHCHFENKSSGLKLVDLESRNGTKVNGEFVNQKYIEPNDTIQIGETFITVTSRLPLSTVEFKELQNLGSIKKNNSDFVPSVARNELISEKENQADPIKKESTPYLVYKLEDGTDKTFILHKDEITIGRSNDAVLTIQDKLSSRIHARIFTEDHEKYFIEDLDSRNGTKINDREVKGKIEIIPNDSIQIGEYDFQFIVPSQKPEQNNKPAAVKSAVQPRINSIPTIGNASKKPRRKFIKKTTNVAGPMIGGLILVIVIIVVIIFFNDLDKNRDDRLSRIGDEPTPAVIPNKFNNNSHNNVANNVNPQNNQPKVPDKTDDDDEVVNDGPEIDNSLDDDPDVNFVNAGKTEFERKARKAYISLRNNVWDNIDMEIFGKAYVDTMDFIKKYQNQVSDEVFDETDKLLLEIKQKATKFWDNDLEPRIKKTPETERGKFYDEILRAFEGYDMFYEPAIQMINN